MSVVNDPIAMCTMRLVEEAQASGMEDTVLALVRGYPPVVWWADLSAELLAAVKRSDALVVRLLKNALRDRCYHEGYSRRQRVPPEELLNAAIDALDLEVLTTLIGEGTPWWEAEGALASPVSVAHVKRAMATGMESVSEVVSKAFQAHVTAREEHRRREEQGWLLTLLEAVGDMIRVVLPRSA